jgi:hypothetical protein
MDMNTTVIEQPDLEETRQETEELGQFRQFFSGWMTMYAPAPVVKEYLDNHQSWFRGCARPMKVEALEDTGYSMGIGRYGAFGFYLEPKIGLKLLPQSDGVYRIETMPVPGHTPTLYSVDFKALLRILETPPVNEIAETQEGASIVQCHLAWELNLGVWVKFPGFIQALPPNLIRKTGDRVLLQIVQQVSRQLTCNVQKDFHRALEIPFPPKLSQNQKLREWHHHSVDSWENLEVPVSSQVA